MKSLRIPGFILLSLSVLVAKVFASDYVNVKEYTDRGVMMYGDTSQGGPPFAKDPSVVKFNGRYLMYYSVPTFGGMQGWRIGVAASKDLLTWEKLTTLEPAHPSEANGFCAPGAIVLGGKVHLFYQTYGNREKDAICHAWSDDGVSFTREPTNPIFHPHGDWTCGRAIDAEVIPYGDRLLLYFASRDPGYKIQLVGVASAPLDSDWARDKWTQLADRTILKPELPWEQECLEAPTLVRRGQSLIMFYAGAYNNMPQQIGSAVSTDGVNWKRISDTPLLAVGQPGSWNASESGHPGVFTDTDGQTYLFYQGNADKGKSWFLSKVKIGWKDDVPHVE
jgi:predicted GH43/DUF377 family glycosyl hydrolase